MFTIFLTFLFGTQAQAAPVGLTDAFWASVKNSETLSIHKELQEQAGERVRQSGATFWPQLSVNAMYLQQEELASATSQNFAPSMQNNVRLTLNQSIFRGLRDLSTLKQRESLETASNFSCLQATRQLWLEVAQNYLLLRSTEVEILHLDEEINLDQKRVGELRSLKNLGRSRESDLLSTEAALANSEALRAGLQNQRDLYQNTLLSLTGWKTLPGELLDPGRGPWPFSASPVINSSTAAVETFLQRAPYRPDVQAAENEALAQDQAVGIARAGHFPTLDFLANYYPHREGGIFKDIHWDFQLQFSLPLFAAGGIQSQVREQVSIQKSRQLAQNQAIKNAEAEIRALFLQLRNDRLQLQKLEQAMDVTRRSSEAMERDYRKGLVTNLDRLNASSTAHATRRAHDRFKYSAFLNQIRWESAIADPLFPPLESKNSPCKAN